MNNNAQPFPMSSLPLTVGGSAEASPFAGPYLFMPCANEHQIIAVPLEFLNQEQAGKCLGHCGEWLRLRAKEHPLFKPSVGEPKQGNAAKYHIVHLRFIARHLMDPEIFTRDSAFKAWKAERHKWIANALEATKSSRKKRSA